MPMAYFYITIRVNYIFGFFTIPKLHAAYNLKL